MNVTSNFHTVYAFHCMLSLYLFCLRSLENGKHFYYYCAAVEAYQFGKSITLLSLFVRSWFAKSNRKWQIPIFFRLNEENPLFLLKFFFSFLFFCWNANLYNAIARFDRPFFVWSHSLSVLDKIVFYSLFKLIQVIFFLFFWRKKNLDLLHFRTPKLIIFMNRSDDWLTDWMID